MRYTWGKTAYFSTLSNHRRKKNSPLFMSRSFISVPYKYFTDKFNMNYIVRILFFNRFDSSGDWYCILLAEHISKTVCDLCRLLQKNDFIHWFLKTQHIVFEFTWYTVNFIFRLRLGIGFFKYWIMGLLTSLLF